MEGLRDDGAGVTFRQIDAALGVHRPGITRVLDRYRLYGTPAKRHAGGRQIVKAPVQDRLLAFRLVVQGLRRYVEGYNLFLIIVYLLFCCFYPFSFICLKEEHLIHELKY
jgi:hypothetical protein